MALIFVDCEGKGPAAGLNDDARFEFGAVEYKTRETFHGKGGTVETFGAFALWLQQFKERPKDRLIFVSDNVAYDWQFINYYFHKHFGGDQCFKWGDCGCNPFGHSGRRIGDYYAGLMQDFFHKQDWKRLRVTSHDHNPVHDAMGNVEAFARLQAGER